MANDVFYVPVPTVCSGQIVEYRSTGNYYYVKVTDNYPTMGAIACSLIYQPGSKSNYQVGDRVRVLITMIFGGVEMKIQGVMRSAKHYIIGLHDKSTMFPLNFGTPYVMNSKDHSLLNRTSDTGFIATDDGMAIITTRGSDKTVHRPFGFGIYENMKQDLYQNHHRIISHNEPYSSKEYFGLYKGKDSDDRQSRIDPRLSFLCYKRFITQTMDPSSWVSTCEGAWNPWVGANNDSEEITKNGNILWTKIINSGSTPIPSRVTFEAGEPGPGFYNFRVDQMMVGEKSTPLGTATPAVSGNKFKCAVSEKGEVELRAASTGSAAASFAGLTFKVDASGNLTLLVKGAIKISHGDADTAMCGLEFDGKGGINITAMGGLKVNGKPVVSSEFVDFFINNLPTMFMPAVSGVIPVPNPAFLVQANLKNSFDTSAPVSGFSSIGLPVHPITGIQQYNDYHATS